jgi:hypothetical protein
MSDRTIWLVRIIAIFIFLLLAYLMLNLYAKLRRMQDDGARASVELESTDESLQIADCRLQITEPDRTAGA